MKIAVIGGGASGLTTAYLLSSQHQVDLFEKEQHLGGNVRTLNRNASAPKLSADIFIENGVLGFHQRSYPTFHRLMDHLQMPLLEGRPGAALFTPSRFAALGPSIMKKEVSLWRPRQLWDTARFFYSARKHWHRLKEERGRDKELLAAGQQLPGPKYLETLLRGILMLSFSTPYAAANQLPAALTDPFLDSLRSTRWSFVKGGVYAYMEKMIPSISGRIFLGAEIRGIQRADGVSVHLKDGSELLYDKVVLATTPGQVLKLLSDPTDTEQRLFSPWKDRSFTTSAHRDSSIYGKMIHKPKSPMDIMAEADLSVKGYNTYMNDCYGIPRDNPLFFAYGLDDQLDPEKVLDRWEHTVPIYTPSSYATRREIAAINGDNHTCFAGAYLGNALHEGAIASAVNTSKILGGIEI
jgi:predicted NAD/FAD-binding protein